MHNRHEAIIHIIYIIRIIQIIHSSENLHTNKNLVRMWSELNNCTATTLAKLRSKRLIKTAILPLSVVQARAISTAHVQLTVC